ncbi:uncharacterized protein BKA78DRAFT_308858 [Phyllosticta capitalensis]|uniref:uncharacterized protein n=1 Tax=Phyllosticta capitalensis TaxID=121624 RepID=UPI00312F8BE9
MQHVDFVDNQKPDLLNKLGVSCTLSSHDVPFFRSGDYDLCLQDLRFSEVHVARQLANLDPEPRQPFSKLFRNLCSQRFHGCHIHNLEVIGLEDKVVRLGVFPRTRDDVLGDCVEDRQHGSICFTSTSRGTDEHVLAGFVSHGIHKALHAIEGLVAFERSLAKSVETLDFNQTLPNSKGSDLACGNRELFELVVVFSFGAKWESVFGTKGRQGVASLVSFVDVRILVIATFDTWGKRSIFVLVICTPKSFFSFSFGLQANATGSVCVFESFVDLLPVADDFSNKVQLAKAHDVSEHHLELFIVAVRRKNCDNLLMEGLSIQARASLRNSMALIKKPFRSVLGNFWCLIQGVVIVSGSIVATVIVLVTN